MILKPDALPGHLQRALQAGKLARVYTVAGDEALLAIEAQDAIRAAARTAGYTERDVLHADGRFDWSLLQGAASGLSLFADKRIIEVRLASGKPGKDGGEALREHARAASDDNLMLVALPRLDRATRESAWAAALEHHGVWIDVARVERAELPAWIGQRLALQGQRAARAALEFLADRVEGNLLAAQQELAKLALLFPPGEVTLEQVTDSVLNVARYDAQGLPLAIYAGDAARATRIVEGLRAEGEALPLALWTVTEEIRTLLKARAALDDGRPIGAIARELRVWGPRERLLPAMLGRQNNARLARLLGQCAEVDCLIKGLRVERRDADPWLELADIAVQLTAGAATGSAAGAPSSPKSRR
jgi:DNA polymerase-3 subunit delta